MWGGWGGGWGVEVGWMESDGVWVKGCRVVGGEEGIRVVG